MEEQQLKKLNLGAGEDYKEGFTNIDWNPLAKPDVQHDLNTFPYPFEENTFDRVEAFHVIEHLDRPFDIMKEIHRILKPGGTLHMKVPHFSRGFTHAEHKSGFDVSFPFYFNPSFTKSGYHGTHFELQKMRVQWLAHGHLLESMGYGVIVRTGLGVLNAIFSFLGNLSPAFMSRVWCYWFGGFDEIEFVFIKR